MKKSLSFLTILFMAFSFITFSSCSNDDDDYFSRYPIFSDVKFVPDYILPGEEITATAVQHKKGKLLNRTEYSWKIIGSDEDLNIKHNRTVLYEDDKSDPTCRFTAPSIPGTYKIIFNGTYSVSGKSKTTSASANIKNGSVDYSSGPFKCFVTVTKTFTVRNK